MINNYDVVIGIEIHLELNSNTKMFSSGEIKYGSKPNTKVNINDLALPGTLPSVNIECIRLALIAAKVLNMNIDTKLRFDRKNYWYSDLPKGFQITQQFFPIGSQGFLTIILENKIKKIAIERVHIEEDTAKQIHKNGKTYLDYNRCGIGLIEIVTYPNMHSANEAVSYVSKIQELISYYKISNAKMNEGSMRCDINISLKPKNTKKLLNKVEIKNLNSLSNIKDSIEYEIKRQSNILGKNQKVALETRRYDEKTKSTIFIRSKSSNLDYHFFPEPNIAPIQLPQSFIDQTFKKLKVHPDLIRDELSNKYKLSLNKINLLIFNLDLLDYFTEAMNYTKNHEALLNFILNDVIAFLRKNNLFVKDISLTPKNLALITNALSIKKISASNAKEIIKKSLIQNINIKDAINKMNQTKIIDKNEITSIFVKIIKNNLTMLNQYNSRPERTIKFFMGMAMKETKGKIDANIAIVILKDLISKHLDTNS